MYSHKKMSFQHALKLQKHKNSFPFLANWQNLGGTMHGGMLLAQSLTATRHHLQQHLNVHNKDVENKSTVLHPVNMYAQFLAPVVDGSLNGAEHIVQIVHQSKRFVWVDSKIVQHFVGKHRLCMDVNSCWTKQESQQVGPFASHTRLTAPKEFFYRENHPDLCASNEDVVDLLAKIGFTRTPPFAALREMRLPKSEYKKLQSMDPSVQDTYIWVRLNNQTVADIAQVVFFTDAVVPFNFPGILDKLYPIKDGFWSWTTLSSSIHFLNSPSLVKSAISPDWLLVRSNLEHVVNGRVDLEMTVWGHLGQPLCTSRQVGALVHRSS
jgi:acyl-CoA thioesterase